MKINKITTSDIFEMYKNTQYFQPYFYYAKMFGCIPKKVGFNNIDTLNLLWDVKSKYSIPDNKIIYSILHDIKKDYVHDMWLPVADGIVLINARYDFDYPTNYHLELLYTEGVDENLRFDLHEIIASHINKEENISYLNLITLDNGSGLGMKQFKINPVLVNIKDNYNDDFKHVDRQIRKRLSKVNDKGIVLLYGMPGTGKTSYIRHLISKIKKRMIYLPTNFAEQVSSPDILKLFIENPNSVIIIEDAEQVISDRSITRNAAITNLLNISDGLLSDCLNSQLICTFNTDISKIDNALLRKGRLIASYEFKPLEKQKAQKLSEKLGNTNLITQNMTLAEIYNQADTVSNITKKRKTIGF